MNLNFSFQANTDVLDRYIRIKKKEPSDFKEITLALTDIELWKGIYAIVGRMAVDNTIAVQSYMFDKRMWSAEEAEKWMRKAEGMPEEKIDTEMPMNIGMKMKDFLIECLKQINFHEETVAKEYAELKTLKGVEIFQVGKWNGENYSMEDLQEMVNNFSVLKTKLQPYVKLGHNEEQNLLAKDGLPAAGWIDRVYIEGKKLVADIVDMPSKIYELVKNKAYKRISSEIYWNLKDESGNIYKRVLKAISLLGGDTPAIGSLADVQALYTKRPQSDLFSEIKSIDFTNEGDVQMELNKEVDQSLKELTEAKFKLSELEKQYTEAKATIEKLTSEKTEIEKQYSELKTEGRKKEIFSMVDELIANKKLLPAQRESAIKMFEMEDNQAKKYSQKEESEVYKLFSAQADVVKTEEFSNKSEMLSSDEKVIEASKNGKSYAESKAAVVKASKEVK